MNIYLDKNCCRSIWIYSKDLNCRIDEYVIVAEIDREIIAEIMSLIYNKIHQIRSTDSNVSPVKVQ